MRVLAYFFFPNGLQGERRDGGTVTRKPSSQSNRVKGICLKIIIISTVI